MGIASLTEREIEVLKLLATAATNKAIAAALGISENTVENHLTSIYCKLEVSGRVQALVTAFCYGFIDCAALKKEQAI